ncbi:MAG: MucR family transcriptional regulator [Hyphomonadaceae bacterium]|jgi:predicted transcriptional regulator|uniref:MucR family transcriptional regulator n=1 Tax=Aquidulcibacter sp. TaxID=2052990 RepID=UPI0022C96BCD|nr:MucR family transcriptional regulator [Aquidulcibacter sp.]MCE2892093.1 MucR family transcriptional regulator [Hyphomonadaceae bacterium]MCZ8207943.1 MucR family transcriptional regulator [Aquidulcibacter sp.]
MSENTDASLIEMTVEIVAAYVAGNELPSSELPGLISTVYASLKNTQEGAPVVESKELVPAVPTKKSVFPDHIVCLEDGKKFKSLKRHLRSSYDMSPDEYRAKWGLPADYPMVAPNYAAARSELAKKIGLGRGRR